MFGSRVSDVKTWDPHTGQKCRVTLGVTWNELSGAPSVVTTAVLAKLAHVVNAAPLKRRHWPQWQLTTLFCAAVACMLTAAQ
jgi:hypothetical protein